MANIGRNEACPCGSGKKYKALQVAAAGQSIEVDVVQTDEAIEVTWSHQFTIRKDFTVTDYADQSRTIYSSYPAARIRALLGRARSSLPPELLASIHIDEQSGPVH